MHIIITLLRLCSRVTLIDLLCKKTKEFLINLKVSNI